VGALVRDSKNPDGPRLCFAAASWSAYLGELSQAPLSR
jgi:hypothetical protein